MDCLFTQGEGANLSPVWQGGTSRSVSMVISRCHSPQRRSEGFLTSVRKRGSLHRTPLLFFPFFFFFFFLFRVAVATLVTEEKKGEGEETEG